MLKTIFFDLGNVLIFFSYEKMFRQLSMCTGLSVEETKAILFAHKLHENYETGQIDSVSVYQQFLKHSHHPFSLHEFMAAASNIFTPNTSLWPVVEQLKNHGIRLILLSNTSECHFNNAYARYPILRLFDDKILSFEVGVMKPDRRIFKKALARAGCDPKECFYTDDIPEFVEEARKAGLDAEIFSGVDPLKKSLIQRCDSLRSSLGILDQKSLCI